MRRAQGGDAAAFGELVARHHRSALRVATVVLGAAHGADDVVQDATVRAWRAVRSLDVDRGFRAWYLRVVANCARNDRRSRGRRAALAVRSASEPASSPPGPEDLAVTDAERRLVIAALNRLRRGDRLVIVLRHLEELTEAEVAEVLRCPPGTVKSRLARAMARLRAELGNAEVRDAGAETDA